MCKSYQLVQQVVSLTYLCMGNSKGTELGSWLLRLHYEPHRTFRRRLELSSSLACFYQTCLVTHPVNISNKTRCGLELLAIVFVFNIQSYSLHPVHVSGRMPPQDAKLSPSRVSNPAFRLYQRGMKALGLHIALMCQIKPSESHGCQAKASGTLRYGF